jgi:hypothetical protein
MSGLIAAFIQDRVVQQIDDHGIVVWFDPQRHYESLLRAELQPGRARPAGN